MPRGLSISLIGNSAIFGLLSLELFFGECFIDGFESATKSSRCYLMGYTDPTNCLSRFGKLGDAEEIILPTEPGTGQRFGILFPLTCHIRAIAVLATHWPVPHFPPCAQNRPEDRSNWVQSKRRQLRWRKQILYRFHANLFRFT